MATDLALILRNLERVYDFTGRRVLHVGAGGGQLIGYARHTRSVLAVDNDEQAVAALRTAIAATDVADRVTVQHGDFLDVPPGTACDVVFFEFCLHEMEKPGEAIRHACCLAGDVVVIDHSPFSPWVWFAAESEKALRSWAAVPPDLVVSSEVFVGMQRFETGADLVSRVGILGEPALGRARLLHDRRAIAIPMEYRVTVLRGGRPL
jgi:SAM-dependent methyltransferase